MSIYIHIPFCRKACTYCDFHFSVNHDRIDELVDALVKELHLRKNYLGDKTIIDTIYFGGGTPSLLNSDQLKKIFDGINSNYSVSPNAEITLEANPDDLTIFKLDELKNSPLNRLSIGVQSFHEPDLQMMNRAHTANMARQSVLDAAEAGFDNITIDLIYGMPGMMVQKWKENLMLAFSLPVKHLSCYSLTVEKKTALEKMIREGKIAPLDDTASAMHFKILMHEAAQHGFEHYEISNFAIPGFYSQHNSSYWKDKPYIGIGPSAHSYNGTSRQWNIANNTAYVNAINKNEIPAETEILSAENKYNEYIMTRLRTSWGADINFIREKFGVTFETNFLKQIQSYIESGDVSLNNNTYILTEKGKLIADRIASDTFVL